MRSGFYGGRARCLGALSMALVCACGGEEDKVPFKRKAATSGATAVAVTGEAANGAGTGASEEQAPPPSTARSHAGEATLELDGHTLEVPGAHASLTVDLSGDGQREALVWAGVPPHPLQLWVATGEKDGFGTARPVERSDLTLPAECGVAHAQFETLEPDKAHVQTQILCEPDVPEAPHRHLLLLSLEAAPRALERVALRDAPDGLELSLAEVRSVDADEDGHSDVAVQLGSSAVHDPITLTWLDRPSGLARDPSEPESTIAGLAGAAEKQLEAGDPGAAEATANAALALHRQLCRSGKAALRVGSTWGLRCDASSAVGQAALVTVRAEAARGDVLSALESLEMLQREQVAVDEQSYRKTLQALSEVAETPAYRLAPVAQVMLPAANPALAPSVVLTNQHLWVGSQPPRMWDIETRQEIPGLGVPARAPTFADPSGQFHVRHIDRDCKGRLLRIVSDQGAILRARVREQAPAAGCALRTPVPDAGDLRVLGWAPQGVVLQDDVGALLVPLDASARPTDPPRRLPPEMPLPAPLPPGRASSGGSCYVVPTAHGLIRVRHGKAADRQLIRPPGWEALGGEVRDAAVAPSCDRFAVATRTHVYLVEPAGPAAGGQQPGQL